MRHSTLSRLRLVALLALIVPGCASPPPSTPPDAPSISPPDSLGHSEHSRETEAFADTTWWSGLGDEELARLIQRALAHNPSLDLAQARVRASRHLIGVEQARLRPQLRASGSYTRADLSENLPILSDFMDQGLVETDQELFAAGFDAAWELDVFGRARRRVDAAEAQAEATEARLHDAQVRMVAEVARTYFDFRNRQRQADLLAERIDLSKSLAALAETRLRTGVGMESAVADAEAGISALQARLPGIRAAREAALYRLEILCALPAEELRERLTPFVPLPAPPDLVPTGLPGSLLRRRPDLRRAEAQLSAASAGLQARAADLYPRFYLTGSAGRQAERFTDLADTDSTGWLIAPSVQWNLYQGGGLRAGVEAARAERDAAQSAYRDVVMRAVGEAETRLTQYIAAFESRERLQTLVKQRQRGLKVARDAYATGVADEGRVLKARLALADARARHHQSRTEVLTTLAALNKALGGGWELPGPADG